MAYVPEAFDKIREKYKAAERKKRLRRVFGKAAFLFGAALFLAAFRDAFALVDLTQCEGTIYGGTKCTAGSLITAQNTQAFSATVEISPGRYALFASQNVWMTSMNGQCGTVVQVDRTPWTLGGEVCRATAATLDLGWPGNFDNSASRLIFQKEILPHTNGAAAILRIDQWGSAQNVRTRVLVVDDGATFRLYKLADTDFVGFYAGGIRKVSFDGSMLRYYTLNAAYWWDEYNVESAPPGMQSPQFPPIVDHNTIYTDIEAPAFSYWSNGGYYIFAPFTGSSAALFRLDTGDITGGGASILERLEAFFFGGTVQVPAIPLLAGKYPVGMVEPADNNVATLATNWTQSGNSLLGTAVSFHGIYPTETGLSGFDRFENPNFYFYSYPNNLKRVDVNCIYPGFDLCTPKNGGSYCTNSNYDYDPAQTKCAVPIDIRPWTYGGGGGSGTWSTGGGTNCIGSGCISQGTGSGAVTGLKDFFDYVLDCDTNDDGETSIGEGIACVPGAIGRFFGGFFDRLSAVWSSTWGLLEELLKISQPSESGSGAHWFGGVFYDTAAAEGSGADNPIITAVNEQIENVTTGDNVFANIFRFVKYGVFLIGLVFVIGIYFSFRR